jgi:hypothetical protein
MNANAMDHEQAMKNLTAERYLLGELVGDDLDAYEEHLFNCSICWEQVSLGTEFIGQLKRSGTQEFVPAHAVKTGFVPSLLASFRQPAAALAFGLLLCVGGFSAYQNSVISRLKEPRPELRFVLTGIAHGAGDGQIVQVPRNTGLSLSVEYTPRGEFVSYNARVLTESGKMKHALELPGIQPASITVPAEALQPGKYTIVISGRTSDGTENEIARGSFELQFTDK